MGEEVDDDRLGGTSDITTKQTNDTKEPQGAGISELS
jgi:hypothetical protein